MYTETGTFHGGHIQVLLEQGSRSPRGGTWTLMAGVRRQITNHPGGARAVGTWMGTVSCPSSILSGQIIRSDDVTVRTTMQWH